MSSSSGVEGGLLGGHVLRVGGGQAEHVLGREQLEDRLQQRAPQRQQVMAFVEDDDAHPGVAQRLHALHRVGGEQLAGGDVGQLARRDLTLAARDDPRDVALAPACRLPVPGRGLGHDLVDALPGRGRALLEPDAVGRVAQHALRVGGLAQRLVGEDVQVRAARAEQRLLLTPLALDRPRRAQHHGGRAEPADDLEADDRLARAGWSDDQGLVAPGRAVGLEGVQAERLVPAPLPGEPPCGEATLTVYW